MKNDLIEKLQEIVKEITKEDIKIEINIPNDSTHGDYTTNVAMRIFASVKGSPRGLPRSKAGEAGKGEGVKWSSPLELAKEIVAKLEIRNLKLGISKAEALNPGFINFYLSSEYLVAQTQKLLTGDFGIENIGKDKKAVVEYSSPNIAKPFTISHLRSTIIGDAIANLLQAVGYTVFRDNHLGDWGTQFGKQIYAIKNIPLRQGFGGQVPSGKEKSDVSIEEENEKMLDSSQNPIKDLVALYVKFHEEAEKNPKLKEEGRKWFKKLEDGDKEARRLWKKCIDWSFKEFDRIYGELEVTFTENNGRGYGEAYFEDKMGPVIEELKAKKLLKESKGAQLVFYPNDVLPPLMILKNDGATLYATRDLATDNFRLGKYGKDILVIKEVGAEQSLYFNHHYMCEQMLGWYKPGQRIHVGHGFFRFKEGKMSTRKGNVIWLEDVLQEAKERAKKLGSTDQQTVKAVGIGALKWNDLKRTSHLDITFDWNEVLSMQGNSGPYIQYTYVRTLSLLQKAADQKYELGIMNYALNPEELEILRKLNKFAEVIVDAAITYSPHLVAQYLFELSQIFNNFYQKYRIVNAPTNEEKEFRLALTQTVGIVLKKGLNLLGISAPEKM